MYVARPGIEPRTPDLRVGCPTDCATRPGSLCQRFAFIMSEVCIKEFFLLNFKNIVQITIVIKVLHLTILGSFAGIMFSLFYFLILR